MSTFDPAAATAAYLATLSPAAHLKALHYTQGGHWLLLWGTVAGVVVSYILIRSGLLTGIRNWLEAKKPRPWLTSFMVGVVYFVISWALTLPWALYAEWWREKSYGLNNQTWGAWLGEAALNAAIMGVFTALFFSVLYALVRRAPKTWWIWSSAVATLGIILVIVLAPVYIEPLFNTYKDVPVGPVREAIVKLARENGVPSDKIYVYDGSRQSSRYTANVSGLFGTARVAISDAMLTRASMAEVRGVVGHEMGHYVHMHALWMAAAYSLILLVQFWLVHVLFAPACRWLGAKDVKGLADSSGLPVVFALLGLIGLLMTPLTNSITRIAETDADIFSLHHANEPDGMAIALVRTIEYRAATPSKLEEIIFYDHPSVSARIRRCMDWKATHSANNPPSSTAATSATAGK